MTDDLHDRLADALRLVEFSHCSCPACGRSDEDDEHKPHCTTAQALASYEAAKKEPAKRVKLQTYDESNFDGMLLKGGRKWVRVDDLKAQGIEVDQ